MNEPYGRFARQREEMVKTQLLDRGISDEAVLRAMRKVPRHFFVPEHLWSEAYEDKALPLGPDQTISQPYIVALMLESLRLTAVDHVLEIGTGSGYQTALLAEICAGVYTVELDPELSKNAERKVQGLGYSNIFFKVGNGWNGWNDCSPFDAVVVAAATTEIPRALVKQLKMNGRMVLPVGTDSQCLVFLEKTEQGLLSQDLGAVRFVPLKDDESHN